MGIETSYELTDKDVEMIENCGLEVDDLRELIITAKRDAIEYLANSVQDAYESGFIDKPEDDMTDVLKMIREHGERTYGESNE